MKDRPARTAAALALVVAIGAYTIGSATAFAPEDASTIAAMQAQIDDQQTQIDDLTAWAEAKDATTDQIIDALQPLDCLAYSTYHGYRETIGPHGKKYHTFPIMLWNVTGPGCSVSKADFKGRRLYP